MKTDFYLGADLILSAPLRKNEKDGQEILIFRRWLSFPDGIHSPAVEIHLTDDPTDRPARIELGETTFRTNRQGWAGHTFTSDWILRANLNAGYAKTFGLTVSAEPVASARRAG